MKITVHAKPGAKVNKIEKIGADDFVVSVKEPAKGNKANFAILEAIAEYFEIPLVSVRMISGRKSKQKILVVSLPNQLKLKDNGEK